MDPAVASPREPGQGTDPTGVSATSTETRGGWTNDSGDARERRWSQDYQNGVWTDIAVDLNMFPFDRVYFQKG